MKRQERRRNKKEHGAASVQHLLVYTFVQDVFFISFAIPQKLPYVGRNTTGKAPMAPGTVAKIWLAAQHTRLDSAQPCLRHGVHEAKLGSVSIISCAPRRLSVPCC